LSKEGKEKLHELKMSFSFMAETIVFILAGIFVGEFHGRNEISPNNIGLIFAL